MEILTNNSQAVENWKKRKALADNLHKFVTLRAETTGQTDFTEEELANIKINNLTPEDIDLMRYVVNMEAFVKWVEYSADPHLNDDFTQQTTSTGETVSLKQLIHRFRAKIEALPMDEQQELLKKHARWHKASGKAGLYKRMAFDGFNDKSQAVTKKVISQVLEQHKDTVLELFGKMHDDKEVLDIVVNKWGVNVVNINDIRRFKAKYISQIKRKIEDYKAKYTDVRLAVKRSRIDEMCWIYNTCKKRYEKDESREDLKLMLTTLKSLKEEVEGNKLLLEGSLDINVEAKVKIHIQRQILDKMAIRNLVIGRVASRMGIPPEFMVKRLQDSYHHNYTRKLAEEGIEDVEFEDISFPSDESYDFDKVEEANQEFEKDRKGMIEQDKLHTYTVVKEFRQSGVKEEIKKKFAENLKLVEGVKDEADRLGLEAHMKRMRGAVYGSGNYNKDKKKKRERLEDIGTKLAKERVENEKNAKLLEERSNLSVKERMKLIRQMKQEKTQQEIEEDEVSNNLRNELDNLLGED